MFFHYSAQLFLLKIISAVVIAGAFALIVHTILISPSQAAGRLGLRGLKRQRSVVAEGGWAQIEPLVRWMSLRTSRLLTPELRRAMDAKITLAGDVLGLTADELGALSILASIGGMLLGFVMGFMLNYPLGICAIFGTAFGLLAPYLQIDGFAQKRLVIVGRTLPYAIDVFALSMGAGMDFPGSVRQYVDKSTNPNDPLAEEFSLLLQSLSLGRTRRDALAEFGARCPIETVTEFVNSLIQAEERGNPVAEVLAIQAASSRQRRTVSAEESASKAGVKLSGPLMLVFISVMGLMIGPMMINMGSMQ